MNKPTSFDVTDLIPGDVLHHAVLFGYLLFFPSLLMLIANQGTNTLQVLSGNFIAFCLFIAIGAIGPRHCRRILMGIMFALMLIWNFADLFCFLQLQTQLQAAFWPLLKSTNVNECSGFLRIYLWKWSNLILLIWLSGGFMLFYLAEKFRCDIRLGRKLKIVFARFQNGFIFSPAERRKHHVRTKKEETTESSGKNLSSHPNRIYLLVVALLLLPPGCVWLFQVRGSLNGNVQTFYDRVDAALDEIVAEQQTRRLLAQANADLGVTAKDRSITIVLVIGESHSKAHSGLYGYARDTNPLLRLRQARGELFVFHDVVAPHSFTMYALPKLLTLAAHDRRESFQEVPNIFDLARSAGFKTFWLCNQPPLSDQSMPYTLITRRADEFHYGSVDAQHPDSALLPLYEAALSDSTPRKLIVLQLIGSHHDYQNTYPPESAVYPLDSVPEHFNPEQKKEHRLVNAYDNSIRYNDYILNLLIDKLEKEKGKSFLLYLPDHGENLFEQPSLVLHMEFLPTQQTVEVPMYLWLSPQHPARQTVPRILPTPFASEDLPYLLLELGGLHYSNANMDKSPLSPSFRQKKRIVSRCNVDYNKLKAAGGRGGLTNQTLQ